MISHLWIRRCAVVGIAAAFCFAAAFQVGALGDTPPGDGGPAAKNQPEDEAAGRILPSVDEARGQAELLHDAMHSTLQLVHHEYYREDEGLTIPAALLKDVFAEIAEARQVKLRWIAVNAPAMNIDHAAADEFEKDAVKALTAGKSHIDSVEAGVYRRAAAITLHAECLKCHLPNRTSTKPRTAGLVISLPIRNN